MSAAGMIVVALALLVSGCATLEKPFKARTATNEYKDEVPAGKCQATCSRTGSILSTDMCHTKCADLVCEGDAAHRICGVRYSYMTWSGGDSGLMSLASDPLNWALSHATLPAVP